MQEMARTTRSNFKRETTHFGGMVSPSTSMSTTNGTFLKDEDGKDAFSDKSQAPSFSNAGQSQNDLDEGYARQVAERKIRRSASPSLESISQSFGQASAAPILSQPQSPMEPSLRASMAPMASGLEIVGEKVNLLVAAIEELRQLGLREIETLLPEIVLVGDQSAGKSSLMGAIAEINLPKDMGMCTRCPANITTAPADEWSCKVSLHESYHFTFTNVKNHKVRPKATPFLPWVENDDPRPVIRAFAETRNKQELERILQWAQFALLNPSTDYHAFIPGTGSIAESGLQDGHAHEADFSPNIVAIEISGPRLPALSFYDLPGVFSGSGHPETQYLVEVFEALVTKYVGHDNALIILTMNMSLDPEHSRTSALIRKNAKAEKRTLGVLTNPDRIPEGSLHKGWDDVVRGTRHVLQRGYFITKQPGNNFSPGQEDYHVKARREEKHFFDTNPLWTGEWSGYQERTGTGAIRKYLSQEFAQLISKNMPDIENKIKAQTDLVDEKLRLLPELPDQNVQHVVLHCLAEFSHEVRLLIEGVSSNDFLSEWSSLSMEFGQAIQKLKPTFVIQDASDKKSMEVINLDSDTESVVSMQSVSKKRPGEFTPPNRKRPHLNNSPVPVNRGLFSATKAKKEGTSPGLNVNYQNASPRRHVTRNIFEAYTDANQRFKSVKQIRAVISKHRRPGHPDNVTDAARQELCLESLRAWEAPLNVLANTIFSKLRLAVLGALKKSLGKYRQTDLYKRSKYYIEEFLELHRKDQVTRSTSFLDLELYQLFTINDGAFCQYKNEELKMLTDHRRKIRAKCFAEGKPNDLVRIANNQKAVKDEQLGPDPFAQEIDLAAYVRGYYRTAGARFADNICQNIQGMLFRKVSQEITLLLEGQLKINQGDSETTCRNPMVEDRGEAKARADLQEEKKKLVTAANRLAKLIRDLNIIPDIHDSLDEDDDMEDDEDGLLLRNHYEPPRAESVDEH